jgi:putative salt-induced outer membrane protein YdiY
MKMKALSVFALVILCVGVASADKVVLKSGSFLTGKAGQVSGGMLAFTSDDLGDVKIKIENIASLDVSKENLVQYNDNTTEKKMLSVKEGALVDDKGAKVDMSRVKALNPEIQKWHGSVNLAYQSARGNTYENSATILANVNRSWEKDRVNASFGYYYSETGTTKDSKEKSTDRWEIEGQHDHFWSNKFYIYENAKYEEDDIAGLDYRLKLGAGGGYQWLDAYDFASTGKWSFNQEVGAAWIKNSYVDQDPSADDSYATVRYAHHLKYLPKWNEKVEAFHNLEYLPQVNDWENYLIKADVGFSTKIVMDFDLLCKIVWDYNSMPSVGRKSSDVRYIVGLGYKW